MESRNVSFKRCLIFACILMLVLGGCKKKGGTRSSRSSRRGVSSPKTVTKHECTACRGTGQVNEWKVEGGDALVYRDESGKLVQKGSGRPVKTGRKGKCPMCDGTGWWYEKTYSDGTVVHTRHDGRPYVSVPPLK